MKFLAAMTTISRISCRTWAVAILVLFAVAGAAVVGDYGVSPDTHTSGNRRGEPGARSGQLQIVRFFLRVVPVDPDDLPDHRVRYGFDNLDFNLPAQVLFDGKCLAAVRLPEYAVDHVRHGQIERKNDGWTTLWEGTITPGRAPTRAGSRRRSSATGGPRRR